MLTNVLTNVGFRASSGVTARLVELDAIGPLLHDLVEAVSELPLEARPGPMPSATFALQVG